MGKIQKKIGAARQNQRHRSPTGLSSGLSGRRLTTERCHSKFRIESREPLEALCVSDVPTLLRLIRRSAKLGAAEVLGKDPSSTEVAPDQFLPSAWPENQAEKLKRLNWKQGMSFKLAASFKRFSRMSTGEKKVSTNVNV